MKARALASAALPAMLLGCATTWDKPGAKSGEWERDTYECRREATYVGTSTGSAYRVGSSVIVSQNRSTDVDYSLYYGCLRARGWERVD